MFLCHFMKEFRRAFPSCTAAEQERLHRCFIQVNFKSLSVFCLPLFSWNNVKFHFYLFDTKFNEREVA